MLKKLILRDFRNYESLNLDIGNPSVLLIGPNGQGKTNLLESIVFLGIVRSFRTSRIRDLKRIGTKGFYIGARLETSDVPKAPVTEECEDDSESNAGIVKTRLEVDYSERRQLKVDGLVVRKASEFIRRLRVAVFSPMDIDIITGQSSSRRSFFDILIATLNVEYFGALRDYQIALRSRNILLKSERFDPEVIRSYNRILVENGVKIVESRNDWSERVAREMRGYLSEIKKRSIDFDIVYRRQNELRDKDEYLKRLDRELDKDRRRGHTSVGPHLDEFDFLLEKKLLRVYGSTGQCRLAALCLKMAKLKLLLDDDDGKADVIALADDVTGELDAPTREAFHAVLNEAGQRFFTFTEQPVESIFNDAQILNVADGKIET